MKVDTFKRRSDVDESVCSFPLSVRHSIVYEGITALSASSNDLCIGSFAWFEILVPRVWDNIP